MNSINSMLQAEARAWVEGRKSGPKNKNFFLLIADGRHWTMLVHPLEGIQTIRVGLDFPEANRLRLELSDAGFVGKVLS